MTYRAVASSGPGCGAISGPPPSSAGRPGRNAPRCARAFQERALREVAVLLGLTSARSSQRGEELVADDLDAVQLEARAFDDGEEELLVGGPGRGSLVTFTFASRNPSSSYRLTIWSTSAVSTFTSTGFRPWSPGRASGSGWRNARCRRSGSRRCGEVAGKALRRAWPPGLRRAFTVRAARSAWADSSAVLWRFRGFFSGRGALGAEGREGRSRNARAVRAIREAAG